MMDTRTVYGYARRMDGPPLVGVVVSIRTFPGVFQVDGSVAPEVYLNPTTDAAGRYETSLVTNARYLIGIPGDVFDIIVPSGVGSVSVEALRATTTALMTNAVQLAFDAAVAAHATLTTAAHGGLVAAGDGRLTNARTPTGSAGGVLSGTYPNPSFAADMATQAELDAALLLKENALGNPDAAGKFLTSTLLGARSWAVPPSGGAAALAWVSLTPYLVNSGGTTWQAEGGTFAPIEYAIDGTFVHIRGAVARTAGSGSIIFTALPVGIRPVYRQFVATAAAAGYAQLNILPAGDVQLWAGGVSALQLTYGWWL